MCIYIWRCLFCIRNKDLIILGYHANFLYRIYDLPLGGCCLPTPPASLGGFAPPGQQGGLGGRQLPNSKIKKLAWYPNMTKSLLQIQNRHRHIYIYIYIYDHIWSIYDHMIHIRSYMLAPPAPQPPRGGPNFNRFY